MNMGPFKMTKGGRGGPWKSPVRPKTMDPSTYIFIVAHTQVSKLKIFISVRYAISDFGEDH